MYLSRKYGTNTKITRTGRRNKEWLNCVLTLKIRLFTIDIRFYIKSILYHVPFTVHDKIEIIEIIIILKLLKYFELLHYD